MEKIRELQNWIVDPSGTVQLQESRLDFLTGKGEERTLREVGIVPISEKGRKGVIYKDKTFFPSEGRIVVINGYDLLYIKGGEYLDGPQFGESDAKIVAIVGEGNQILFFAPICENKADVAEFSTLLTDSEATELFEFLN